MPRPSKNLINMKFGKITVISHHGMIGRTRFWGCVCDCGIEKIIAGNSLKSGITKSCGCYRRSLGKSYIGKNNPSYKHSKTDEERLIERSYPEYIEWRKSVYKRDNYTCQCCGSKKTAIAHHLENYADNPKLRLDVNNGITLCKICHIQFHKDCGKRNNTKDQFYNWLKIRDSHLNWKLNYCNTREIL